MKDIKVKFNNVWDDYGDCEEYEIVIFHIPNEIDIDIENETRILNRCHTILNDYDCDDEEDLAEALDDYEVTLDDLNIAKYILDNGASGLIAERIADFISEKYSDATWEMLDSDCDLEIDID